MQQEQYVLLASFKCSALSATQTCDRARLNGAVDRSGGLTIFKGYKVVSIGPVPSLL